MTKIIILTLGVCVLCCGLLAYMVSGNEDNLPSGALVKIVMTTPDNPDAVYPDSLISQKVTARNISGKPCYVRIKVTPEITGLNGEKLDAEIGKHVILSDLNTTDWMDGRDGYFYYCKILQPGETAPQLYSQVALSKKAGNEYGGTSVSVKANTEAVEAVKGSHRSWWDQLPESGSLKEIDNRLMNLK